MHTSTHKHTLSFFFLPGKCAHSAIHPKIRLEMAPMLDDPVILTYLLDIIISFVVMSSLGVWRILKKEVEIREENSKN